MSTYLNVENRSIQYEEDEKTIQLDYEESYIESLPLDEVRDIVKQEIEKCTDYHFNYL